MKKRVFSAIIVALTFFVLGFVYEFHYPKLKEWVKTQIYLQSYDNLPVIIKINDIELSPFTLSAKLKNLEISPKVDLAKTISEIKVKSIEVRANLLSLFLGRFEVRSISVNSPNLAFIYKTDPNAPAFKVPPIEFTKILSIPIDELEIVNGQVLGRLDDYDQSLQIHPFNFLIKKGFSSIYIEVNLPDVKVKQKKVADSLTTFGLFTKLSLSSRGTDLIDFKLNKDDSFIVAKGEAVGNPLKLQFLDPTLVASWKVHLEPVKNWVNSYRKGVKLPNLSGDFEGSVNILQRKNATSINGKTDLKDFKVDGYHIGNVTFSGNHTNNAIEGLLTVNEKQQQVEVTKLRLFLDDKYSFEGNVNIKSFELNQLLQQIKVGDSPLRLQASGILPCSGEILPKFYANCDGSVTVNDFFVHAKPKGKNNIVAVKDLTATGKLHVNLEHVIADAKLKLPNSTGHASARIDYSKGFRVDFSSDDFLLEDIKELSGLQLVAKTKVNGYTEGNSSKATFVINTDAKDAYFEDFHIGDLSTRISYANPNLKIQNVKGSIDNTSYNGDILLNFNTDAIDVNMSLPNVNLAHIPKIVEQKIKIPFEVNGSGNLNVHVHGPLEVSKLNYDINGQFHRLLIGKESVDSVQLRTFTKNGVVNINGTELLKSRSKVKLQGTITTSGDLNIDVEGRNIRLEESESIQRISQGLHALTDLKGEVRGNLRQPVVKGQIDFKQLSLGSASYKNSSIDFSGNRESGAMRAKLFNDQVIGSMQWNYDTKSPLLIDASFNNWDYSPLFSLISTKNEREGFRANLNGNLSAQYDLNNVVNSKISLDISDFLLSRGILDLKNQTNMSLNYSSDGLVLKNFQLSGNNNSKVLITSPSQQAKAIRLNAEGNINLALISFLTPFMTDVRGGFTFQTNLSLSQSQFEIMGNAKVSDGYAKLADFPVPFEKIEADYTFSQNRVLINRFRSEFGGGLLRGSGNIAIHGIQDVPLRIEMVIDSSNIGITKGLELLTSGNLVLSGNWFPYILKGDIDIRRGMVTQDNSEAPNRLRKSYLLPDILKKQELTPIELDINASLLGRNIKVVNDFVNTSIIGDLHIAGNPLSPTINGSISQAQRGEIHFNENTFDIETLNVSFVNDQNMNPGLYVLANTRVKEYDITMTVGGTLQDLRPSFTSQPPLNESDIITLLTLGYTQATLSDEQNEPSTSGNAIGLGSAIINRNPLNRQIEDKTGISVRFNSATDSADENITVPKVEVSKKWGNRLETKASRTFGKNLKNDAKVQYKINDKVSVIGSWEAETTTDNSEFNTQKDTDIFGIDLEYKIEFK